MRRGSRSRWQAVACSPPEVTLLERVVPEQLVIRLPEVEGADVVVKILAELPGLEIEKAERMLRNVVDADRPAIDALVRARRPGRAV